MDRLAENLQKLSEDNLLTVVQMIHDNKTDETYTKNDLDRKSLPDPCSIKPSTLTSIQEGEFHVDLYTLPDTLVKDLWTYSEQKLRGA